MPDLTDLKRIKLFQPDTAGLDKEEIWRMVESGTWCSGMGGPLVTEFEEKVAEYLGVQHAVMVNSGTAALHLSSLMHGINPPFEAIVPSLTFASTVHCILWNGGTPVFAEVSEKDLCLDMEDVRRKITKKRTRLIIPVDFGGIPCDYKALKEIVDDEGSGGRRVEVLSDSCQAFASSFEEKRLGSFVLTNNHVWCFSFHPVKSLPGMGGGLISIPEQPWDSLKHQGLLARRFAGIDVKNRQGAKYDVITQGWNYYPLEISAYVALKNLSIMDRIVEKRRALARRYVERLPQEYERKMPLPDGTCPSLFWIRISNGKRDEVASFLAERGIETSIHYAQPIHTSQYYSALPPLGIGLSRPGTLPVTEMLAEELLSIPFHTGLTEEDQERVIEALEEAL